MDETDYCIGRVICCREDEASGSAGVQPSPLGGTASGLPAAGDPTTKGEQEGEASVVVGCGYYRT